MATYFVASGGSNTSPYDTWAKAATSLATALAAASTAGDVVVIQYDAVPSGDASLSADTGYTFAANISLVSASNDGGSAYTLTAMDGVNQFIGSSTASINISFFGNDRVVKVWGIGVRNGGSLAKEFRLTGSVGQSMEYDSCTFNLGTNNGSGFIRLTFFNESHAVCKNCTFKFANSTQAFSVYGPVRMYKCSLDSSGTAQTNSLFYAGGAAPTIVHMVGCDWSFMTSGSLIANIGASAKFYIDRCKLGNGSPFAYQTSNPTFASAELFVSDCIYSTTRIWGHWNAYGSTVKEESIYYTGSEAGNQSWKIVGTSNASYRQPYATPWIEWHNTGTSAITPRFEILRDGSTTAYTDKEVWAEFSWKNTASSPLASGFQGDSDTFADFLSGAAGTNQDAGAGTGSWTGESGSAWSGKVDSGSAITPTEAGILRGRVCVASNITVYVDPVIRTA